LNCSCSINAPPELEEELELELELDVLIVALAFVDFDSLPVVCVLARPFPILGELLFEVDFRLPVLFLFGLASASSAACFCGGVGGKGPPGGNGAFRLGGASFFSVDIKQKKRKRCFFFSLRIQSLFERFETTTVGATVDPLSSALSYVFSFAWLGERFPFVYQYVALAAQLLCVLGDALLRPRVDRARRWCQEQRSRQWRLVDNSNVVDDDDNSMSVELEQLA
jgi:hypothetical protein